MRARLVGVLAICSWAAYGCGSSTSSTTPIDARDGAAADRSDVRADADVRPDAGGDVLGDGATDRGDVPRVDGADARDGAGDRAADASDGGGTDADAARADGGGDVGAPTCSDRIKNSDETDIDCGGHCGKCPADRTCLLGVDCTFGVCRADHTCGACGVAADCPGAESECQHRSCTAGVCGIARDPVGTVVALQTTGDCKSRRCDATGVANPVNDNADLPDDRNACTNDFCMAGVPSHTMLALNTSCGGLNRCNSMGQCVGCVVANDCPGTDTTCQRRTCSNQGVCGVTFMPSGTALADPTVGDCKGLQCDGAGNTRPVTNNADLPVDNNPCTTDECTAGTPSHRPVASSTTCGTGLVCDGANRCVQCLSASTCTGSDTECHTRTCINGTCGVSNTTGGTPTVAQVARDCKRIQCTGTGTTFTVPDITDLPNDGNPCTSDLCNGDAPSNPRLAAGTNCGGTSVCDGAGVCIGCLTPGTCPGTDTECHTRTCSAAHQCGVSNAMLGTPLLAQTIGDCRRNQCDGNGGTQIVNDNADLRVDGNVCTQDVCTNGTPTNPPLTQGTSCGGALMCNGSGACVGCVTVADCPIPANACQTRSCSAAGQCLITNVGAGTLAGTQTPRDCQRSQCDGMGHVVSVPDNTDLPTDVNPCTQDLCTNGVPSHPPEPQDTACALGPGAFCNGIQGAEACVQCNRQGQCPNGPDTDCRVRTCSPMGVCGVSLTAAGTTTSSQTPGDCMRNQCNSAGIIVAVVDTSDLRVDGNICTQDLCSMAGVPSNPPVLAGVSCSASGGSVCNGSGACVGCNTAADCPPGGDTLCSHRVCSGGMCSVAFTANNTLAGPQTPADCRKNVCDGRGVIVSADDNADLPVDDGNQCTQDVCSSGQVSHAPFGIPHACLQGNGVQCDGAGTCVQCLGDGDCDTSHDTACGRTRCESGRCNFGPVLPAPVLPDTTLGDCQHDACDGMGGVSPIVDDNDLPANTSECAVATCTVGMPSVPNRPHGTSCTQNNGRTCDGAGSCLFTVSIVRIGDGSAALGNISTATFIEERRLDGTLVGTPVALPTVEGPSHAFGLSGTATSDGQLSLSADGHFLVVAGYNRAVAAMANTVNVVGVASATVNRLVARVDASLSVDTTTLLGGLAFSGNNVRGVTTNDGLEFWTGGAGGANAGVWFIPYGQATAAPTQVFATAAVRWVQVFGGQLYGTSNNTPNANVFTVGSGLPTTVGQTLTSLNGMPTAGNSPFGFVAFDRDGAVPGIDTIYVADDVATRGIQKWTATADASMPPVITWALAKTINTVSSGTSPVGFRGLAGFESGADITLVATTGETNGSVDRLVVFVDSGSAIPTGTVVVSSPANTTFRGVALSPHL